MPLARMAPCGVARLDRSDRTLRRVRVLCVGNMYPPHQWRLRADLARRATALREAGHGVRVLTTDSRLPKAADLEEEDEVPRDLRWPRAAIGSRA